MKYVQSITFRALCALCVGGLLLAFPDETTRWLVVVVGILFLIPGMVSVVAYFRMRSSSETLRPLFSIVGAGSLLFGLVLILGSHTLMAYMKYVLGAFLLLAGISFIVSMLKVGKYTQVSPFFYCAPVILSMAGLFIFFNLTEQQLPDGTAVDPGANIIIGISYLGYGLLQMISAIRFRKVRRQMALDTHKSGVEAATVAGQPTCDAVSATPAECETEAPETFGPSGE